jgi:fibronectin-binding autotransporter adhesin
MVTAAIARDNQAERDPGNRTGGLETRADETGGKLFVGSNTCANSLVIRDGTVRASREAAIGYDPGSRDNSVQVIGTGSAWKVEQTFVVGYKGSGNFLAISNGAAVYNDLAGTKDEANTGWIGFAGDNNKVTVAGDGSVWSNHFLCVGEWGSGNALEIAAGGTVRSETAWIGRDPDANSNRALVTGPGSTWINPGTLYVGNYGMDADLEIRQGATVVVGELMVGAEYQIMGKPVPQSFNEVILDGGALVVTNSAGTGVMVLAESPSKFLLRSGTATVDRLTVRRGQLHLYMQYGPNLVMLNGGTLSCGMIEVDNDREFMVGNGAAAAEYRMRGGIHSFANGLNVRTNSVLSGNGTVRGETVINGRTNLDGGKTVFEGSVANNGVIEVKSGASVVFSKAVVNKGVIIARKEDVRFDGGLTGQGALRVPPQ